MVIQETRRLTEDERHLLHAYLSRGIKLVPINHALKVAMVGPGCITLMMLPMFIWGALQREAILLLFILPVLLYLFGFIMNIVPNRLMIKKNQALLDHLDSDLYEVTVANIQSLYASEDHDSGLLLIGVIDDQQLLCIRGKAIFRGKQHRLRHFKRSQIKIFREPQSDTIIYLQNSGEKIPSHEVSDSLRWLFYDSLADRRIPAVFLRSGTVEDLGIETV